MKKRVTIFLEEVPFNVLKVMAATENTTMSDLITAFVLGQRQNVSDPKEIKRLEKKHNIEPDDSEPEDDSWKKIETQRCQFSGTYCNKSGRHVEVNAGGTTYDVYLCQEHIDHASEDENVDTVVFL